MNHYNDKTSFRNPIGLEDMSLEDRSKYWKEITPSQYIESELINSR